MVSFESDYNNGACPQILCRLNETNGEILTGYGKDPYCAQAAQKIREACACPDAEVYFLVGGTQTNQTVISTVLAPYEGVIAAVTGHINGHEAGAIEYSGHKVLPLPQRDGKISATDIDSYVENFYAGGAYEHGVFPGMVYISHPTEYGTLYSCSELEAIAEVCHRRRLPLYLDGARLGYALASPASDLPLKEIARLCDIFYIGGTKVGALCGEAVVFTRHNAPTHFITQIKQHGAMLAKGRLLGIQFDALFTDGLYETIGRHAVDMAQHLKAVFAAKGVPFYLESPTNQQFVILTREQCETLAADVCFKIWKPLDGNRVVARFVTGWATTEEDICTLDALL